jgi:hypothetical protein
VPCGHDEISAFLFFISLWEKEVPVDRRIIQKLISKHQDHLLRDITGFLININPI